MAQGKRDPKAYNAKIRQLFHAMAEGSTLGEHDIRYFNGGLFDDDAIVEMDAEALGILAYGWPHDLGDEEILARLLALNLERASATTG